MDVAQLAVLTGTGLTQLRNHYERHVRSEKFIDKAIRSEKKSEQTATRQ